MGSAMQIALDEEEAEQVRELAIDLEQTPEKVAEEAMANGMLMLRRYAYLKKRSKNADIGRALEILNRAGKDNPPDPGDELPEDLQYLLTERVR